MADIIPSSNAKDYINDEGIEIQWAMKTLNHADVYFNLICAVADTKILTLTKMDDEIYTKFREQFKDLKVDNINVDLLKSAEGKEKWRPYCEDFKDRLEDYNFGTLLRIDCTKKHDDANTVIVPRVQFLAIEIARNREGFNAVLKDKFRGPEKDQNEKS
ncbi:protein PBDC1-like [Tubulanus polymorphus]|uniref:protein PBDC1-like n=1 Tax=Tubulanus polymorphus TaxID=672921 RepID=UPI003DA56B76